MSNNLFFSSREYKLPKSEVDSFNGAAIFLRGNSTHFLGTKDINTNGTAHWKTNA
jgi:hypothetical protein